MTTAVDNLSGDALRPPEAHRQHHVRREHGKERVDPYAWLSRRNDPAVLEFLRANNRHAEAAMRHTASLQARIERELRHLTPPDEGAPPCRRGPFLYRLYHAAGHDYPLLTRRHDTADAAEEILLDVGELAAGHDYFALDGYRVSPDHTLLAYAVDAAGDHSCTVHVKDLARGVLLCDRLEGVDGTLAWSGDSRTLFYVRLDPVTFRPCFVCRHVLGAPVETDSVVYEEKDEAFRCFLGTSRSGDALLLTCFSNDTSEVRFLSVDAPEGTFQPIAGREPGHEYEADPCGDAFVICTNRGTPDYRVCEAPLGATTHPDRWREVVPACAGVYIDHAVAFRRYLALVIRLEGQVRIRVIDRQSGEAHDVPFEPLPCEVWIEETPGVDTTVVRIGHTSLVTPVTYYDYDMATRKRVRVQTEAIPGYRPELYVTQRVWARSHEGARVPVSLVYRRDRMPARGAPVLLFGYGAYGTNMPLYFDQAKLVLLDRGFVYAMAHVRGGSELGGHWARGGRLLQKENTFEDFIACAEHLVAEGIGRRDALFAESLSAGGLLLGAVMNRRPDLFRGVVALAPFVDLLSTMADPECPLTAAEYPEWGDPRIRQHWAYMRGYSPYDNVKPAPYPHLLATASLNDSQVPFWEPAKWVARLREANQSSSHQLLRTNLSAGHAGTSGRVRRLRDLAFIYAFLLDLAGIRE